VTVAQRSNALQTAVSLRFPVWEREVGTRTKIEQLEEFVSVGAYWQGELESERLDCHDRLDELERQWQHLAGWEQFKRTKTETAVEDAKRQLRPELYDELVAARKKIRRLSEQIDRLERDYAKASRVYTMLTGS
jgi:predicted RNase H-like nuclease (RuvC/YqgF family)